MRRPPPLDMETATAWSARAHAYVLEALMVESSWTCRDVAFHGGTSLHLSWNSPRHSEDLDFLLSREVSDVKSVMRSVERRVQERFMRDDPTILIEVKDKTRDEERMPYFQVYVSSSARLGKAMVKVEFWRVDPEYLAAYPTEFKTPVAVGDMVSSIQNPIPAAKLATAYCDKLTAFATRPHLKWRDVFDLWWIATQTREPLDLPEVGRQFLHNVSAYSTREGLSPGNALRLFLERDDEEIFAEAERDLRRWLPERMWQQFYPATVRQMVAYTRHALTSVADYVEDHVEPEDGQVLKRSP